MHLLRTATYVLLIAVALALPAVALDYYPPAGAGGPTDLRAYTRFVHLISGVGPVSLSLGSDRFTDLDYGQATRYRAFNQGNYPLGIRPLCETLLGQMMNYGPVRLYSQFYSTVLLVGQPDAIHLVQLPDDPDMPSTGKVRVRFVNVAQCAVPLSLNTSTGTKLFSNVSYGCATDYKLITKRTRGYSLNANNESNIFEQTLLPPRNGRVYTIIAYGGPERLAPYNTMVLVERWD